MKAIVWLRIQLQQKEVEYGSEYEGGEGIAVNIYMVVALVGCFNALFSNKLSLYDRFYLQAFVPSITHLPKQRQ